MLFSVFEIEITLLTWQCLVAWENWGHKIDTENSSIFWKS